MAIDTQSLDGNSHSTTFESDPHVTQQQQQQQQFPKNQTEQDDYDDDDDESKTENADIEKGNEKDGFKKKVKDAIGIRLFSGILMVLAGVAIAFQAGCNATLNKYGGRSFSSVVTFALGAFCCLLFFIFDITVLKTPPPSAEKLKTAPWYAWIGGILGSYYVISNILTVPKLGTATVLSIFVCAQIIMACIMDHFGFLGIPKRKYTIWRILASLGLIGCVVVIAKF